MSSHFSKITAFYWHLGLVFPICSSVLARPSPLYFSKVFRHGDFIIISSKSSAWQGDPLGGVLFTVAHICALHLTCVFPSLANDMHIIGPTLDVLLDFFVIIGGIWHIKTFNATNEVCCLVSTGVKSIYITSFKFSYTWV